jgi:6-phosphogluconolactonase (cycloisomerase 2 family)
VGAKVRVLPGARIAAALIGLLLIAGALSLPAAASASQVYVSGSGATGNAISPFSVGSNGSLTPISCGANCATGTAPIGVAMSPNGQYLYTSAFTPNKVSVFSVGSNGSLSPVTCSGTNCNTGTGPYGIALTPNGQYLYTANNTGNTVSAFSVGSGGALTPVTCSGSNCNTGTKPYGVAVTPNGQYLYTANNNSNSVSAFSIGSNGSLTPITCSGGNCTTGTNPEGIAVSPNGQYLYTANRGSSTGAISVFSIGSNGALTPVTCGSGCNWGTVGAFSLAISSNGQYLYSTIRNATSKVATFSINSNGTLSAVTCSGTNCNVGASAGGVAVSPNNQFAYASSFTANNVSPYSIGGTGALTPIACTSPNCNTAAGPDFQSVVVSPDQAPTAAFSATAARPGQASSFNASASTASSGQTVARYDWNFGDGQTASNGGATPTHTYSAEGNYTATVTVTDDAGCSTGRTFTGQTVSCNGSSVATISHTVSVDGTPPDTLIDSAGHGTSANTTPSFSFHSTESGSTFQCSIDTGSASWGACSGPGATHTSSVLADGTYTFRVRATDAQGNTDATPATETFTVDTTPPNTIIDSVAHGTTADSTPTFDFHSTESGSGYQCSIDTGTASWGSCSGPSASHTPSDLTDGTYSFRVRATDASGNTDPSPATESFTVDTTPPNTLIDSTAHGTTTDPTPSFDFHSTEAGSTFECSVDTGTPSWSACSSSFTSSALGDGSYTFRVRATDAQGNTDATPATEGFTVDTTAPDTSIDSGPAGATNDASPTFAYSGTPQADVDHFECRLDAGSWATCPNSGKSYSSLADGSHTFSARAVDAVGNTDATPAIRSFNVDTAPPTISVTGGPTGATSNQRPTFSFDAEPGSTVQCSLDQGTVSWHPCSSSWSDQPAANLSDGSYTFRVQATDSAANQATDTRSFSVDAAPPDTLIDSMPHGTSANPTPSFDFHSTEAGSTFECSIDTGTPAYGPCSGPGASHTSAALADGTYSFRVRSTDPQGNTDPSAATESFTVDTVVPDLRCPAVHISLDNYTPTEVGTAATLSGDLGRTVPGIRARVRIAEPSQLQIVATLRWTRNGKPNSVDLGARTLANAGTRTLRLALPGSLADDLPRGTPVTLKLTVAAIPHSSPGCKDPAVQHLGLRTQVIRVLAGTARLRILRPGRPQLHTHLNGPAGRTRRLP